MQVTEKIAERLTSSTDISINKPLTHNFSHIRININTENNHDEDDQTKRIQLATYVQSYEKNQLKFSQSYLQNFFKVDFALSMVKASQGNHPFLRFRLSPNVLGHHVRSLQRWEYRNLNVFTNFLSNFKTIGIR